MYESVNVFFAVMIDVSLTFRTQPASFHLTIPYTKLDQFIAQYPTLQSYIETMKNFLASKYFLLFIFGILLIVHAIKAEVEKTPPKTLQIGIPVVLLC